MDAKAARTSTGQAGRRLQRQQKELKTLDLIELGAVLADFFDQGLHSPSHDEITNAIARAGLSDGDPRRTVSDQIGKVKRVRAVLIYATDANPAAGLQLAQQLVALLRADGAFTPSAEGHAGDARIAALQRAFRELGYSLDSNGGLRPLVIDNLAGTELTDALRSYVRRANLNPDDAALQVGTAKELDEAAARHVLVERAGGYSPGTNFPTTLAQTFFTLGLEPAPAQVGALLDANPHRAIHQCLFQLACAVNRLRNEVGSGHGRPGPSTKTNPLTPHEARLITRSTALIAGWLLDQLEQQP